MRRACNFLDGQLSASSGYGTLCAAGMAAGLAMSMGHSLSSIKQARQGFSSSHDDGPAWRILHSSESCQTAHGLINRTNVRPLEWARGEVIIVVEHWQDGATPLPNLSSANK